MSCLILLPALLAAQPLVPQPPASQPVALPALQPPNPQLLTQPRTLRYHPEGSDFTIINGTHRFNRALYGTNTAFRVEAGDLPEFALYMPGMGGNLSFYLVHGATTHPLKEARYIKATYRPGSMLYEIRDPLLGAGILRLAVEALADAEGLIVRFTADSLDPQTLLLTRFGGASGKKFSRDGDIGADPESSFDIDSAALANDHYTLNGNTFQLTYGDNKKLQGVFPASIVNNGNRLLAMFSPAIFQGVAGPDTGIGVIEAVAIGIEISFLPRQVALQHGPHLAYIGGIAGPIKMDQQLIDEYEIHIIVMRTEVAVGIATDIAAAEERRAEFFQLPGKMQSSVGHHGAFVWCGQLGKAIAG